jgi:predicted nucleic acid-binding protein
MIAVDSSVAVAGILAAHENHEAARRCLEADRPRLVAHSAFETYSVLTRLPLPDRLSPSAAWRLLDRHFRSAPLVLRARSLQQLLASLANSGVWGGSVYDGLVAGTAKEHGAELVTLDRRAVPTYEAVGVAFRLLGDPDHSD